MCLPNINIIANLYKNYTVSANNVKTFEAPFDKIVAIKDEYNAYIEDFFIVIDYRILGSSDETKKETNVVEMKKPLYVKIRLSKLSADESGQYFLDLGESVVDIGSDDIHVLHACVNYVSLRQIFKVDKNNLSDEVGFGNFVLKILVKTDENEKWNVQSLTPLRIE